MNIFAAGLPSTTTAGGGQLPASFALSDLGSPAVLKLLVVGHKLSCCGVGDNPGADGNANLQTAIVPKTGSLSGIVHHSRNLFLTGVFVPAPGNAAPRPPDLAYYAPADLAAGTSPPGGSLADTALDMRPALGQVFFIGDGRGIDAGGQLAQQRFHVPDGATTLYLGFADGLNIGDPNHGTPSPAEPGSYADNSGEVTVHVGSRYHGVGTGDVACAPGATPDLLDQASKQLTAQLGGTSTHVSFDWVTLEPRPPAGAGHAYSWGAADAQVERALAQGLEPFAFTGNVPGWLLPPSCPAPSPPPPTGCDTAPPPPSAPPSCLGYRSFPDEADHPDAEANLRAFATALAGRYCHRVHHYEFWNEENGCGSPDAACSGSNYVEGYTRWLRVWYQAMKAACPDTVLAIGGLACDSLDHPEYCKDYLEAIDHIAARDQLGTIYDAVSVHPYGTLDLSRNQALNWSALRLLDSVLAGTDKPVWLDEWGWNPRPSPPPAPGSPAYDAAKAKGELDKASAITTALAGLAATRYDRVTEARYLVMSDLPGAWWGLTDWDPASSTLKPRPSWCALCRALHGGQACPACPAGP